MECDVEETSDGQLRVQVQAPSLPQVIAHPAFPYREEPMHPFLRPLRRLFVEGSPDLGRVWYILVSGGPRTFPGVVLALALTKGTKGALQYRRGLAPHRLSVFPGWGSGYLTFCIQGGIPRNVDLPIDHYTFEEKPGGTIVYHATTFRMPGQKKPHFLSSRSLHFQNEHGLHLLRLGIRDPNKLDPVGAFWAKHTRLPHLTSEECREILGQAILPRAPFIQLPEGEAWTSGRYLDLNLILTSSGLQDIDYPVPPWSTGSFVDGQVPPDVALSRMVPLRFENLKLVLIWASRPGSLKHDFVWYSRSRAA